MDMLNWSLMEKLGWKKDREEWRSASDPEVVVYSFRIDCQAL
jgi:hypothetical protein